MPRLLPEGTPGGGRTETLKVAFLSTNTYPTPAPTYGGEIAAWDLVRSLCELGHEVDLYAVPGSKTPPNGRLFFMRASYGSSTPWFWESEQEMLDLYGAEIRKADVVDDHSHTKRVAEILFNLERRTNIVNLLWGSAWSHPKPPFNVIVWSEAMRQMGLKGWTGYEGSPWAAQFANPRARSGSLKDAHVVQGGVDTDFYCPGDEKEDYFLWFARFHPSKGYQVAIELAKRTGIPLVMAGLHPDDAVSPDHREGALQAIELAKGVPNIRFEWLPTKDHHAAKRRVLQRARALLYTVQYQECWGIVMAETLACGTPIIGTNFGAVPELVTDGKTGFVCDSMEQLAHAIEDIDLIRPEDCARDARERFDRRVMAKAYVDEYKRVMNGEVWGL